MRGQFTTHITTLQHDTKCPFNGHDRPLRPMMTMMTRSTSLSRLDSPTRTDSMAPAPDSIPALTQEIEAGVDSLRIDSLRHGQPRVLHDLHLLTRIEGHLQANPPSPADVAEEVNPIAPRRSSVDRHKDDVRPHWFEPLNDTTLSSTRPGRTKRKYRKTPPPPINRHQSTSEIAATPSQDDICAPARLS